MRLVIRKSYARNGYELWLMREIAGKRQIAKANIVFEDADPSYLLPEPTLHFSTEEWRQLADSLKEELIVNGFQPRADVLEGELKATKSHLEDMRTLVFKP